VEAEEGEPLAVLRQLFEDLGLNGSQSRVLAALVDQRHAPAAQLHRMADVPRTSVYTLLEELRVGGLARQLPIDGPARWVPADPEDLVTRLRDSQLNKIATASESRRAVHEQRLRDQDSEDHQRRAHVESLTGRLRNLVSTPGVLGREGPAAAYPYMEVLSGPIQLSDQYVRCLRAARSEVLVLNRGPYGEIQVEPAVLEALDRGVKIRALYVEDELSHPDAEGLREVLGVYHKAGVQGRVVDAIPMGLAIFDCRSVLYALCDSLAPTPGGPTAVHTSHPEFGELQAAVFARYWEHSRPFPMQLGTRPSAEPDDDVEVNLVGRSSRRARVQTRAGRQPEPPFDAPASVARRGFVR